MKPKPLSSLNHLTVPVAMLCSSTASCALRTREEAVKRRLRALGTAMPDRLRSGGYTLHGSARPLGSSFSDSRNDESPAAAGLPEDGRGGFRTCDLSRVKRALSH